MLGRDRLALETEVTLHALGWLTVGNLVGLLLSGLLLFPAAGALLGPLTYGRWMPVHLDAQLYGWCALPLIGLLFRLYELGPGDAGRARWALAAWSGTLGAGCVAWLAGRSSGKPFLEWAGASRVMLVAAMAFLGVVLAVAWWRGARRSWTAGGRARLRSVGSGILLVGLLAIPAVMIFATSRATYPPYNPDSGGATGGSLLGSSLMVVGIFLLTPAAMGLRPRRGWRAELPGLLLLALHFAWFAALDHGNRSHHELVQIVSLASLVIWPPILVRYFRRFDWPSGSRRWLGSLLVWGALLVSTGVPMFLPGVLERVKFTSVLVGHAHLAMAGMCSSYLVLVLVGLLRRTALAALFSDHAAFRLWHAGNALHIASLVALGLLEGRDPAVLFEPSGMALGLLALRVAAGLLLLVATVRWLLAAVRSCAAEAPGWVAHAPQAEAA